MSEAAVGVACGNLGAPDHGTGERLLDRLHLVHGLGQRPESQVDELEEHPASELAEAQYLWLSDLPAVEPHRIRSEPGDDALVVDVLADRAPGAASRRKPDQHLAEIGVDEEIQQSRTRRETGGLRGDRRRRGSSAGVGVRVGWSRRR